MTDTGEGLIPTFTQRSIEAGLPELVSAESLLGKKIIMLEWTPDTAMVPDTGKVTEGFHVSSHIIEEDKTVEWFCGQKALVRALKAVQPPFSTVLRKDGRTYLFT